MESKDSKINISNFLKNIIININYTLILKFHHCLLNGDNILLI
jgi:hypothetical protein